MNKRIIFFIGGQYFPYSLYLNSILKKYGSKEAPAFVNLEVRSLLGLRAKLVGESCFEQDLAKCDITRKYMFYGLVALLFAIPLSYLITFYLLLKCVCLAVFSRNSFLHHMLRLKSNGIVVGDCMCSESLRKNSPRGVLEVNLGLIQSIHRLSFEQSMVHIFVKISSLVNQKYKPYFVATELTYSDELKRRLMCSLGCVELRLEYQSGMVLPILPSLTGTQIIIRDFNTVPAKTFDYENSEEYLKNFVYRNTVYRALPDCDIDTSLQFNQLDVKNFFGASEQKQAVIYLHQVSDAAYVFGVDCFVDLHEWLITSIRLLTEQNIAVIIKVHPAYFSKLITYPIDLKYAKHLEDVFGVSFSSMPKNGIQKSRIPDVSFVHHEVPLFELNRVFPNFLCITHHGTVATEAAYLGHSALVSVASPYLEDAKFVERYSSVEEYADLILNWKSGALIQSTASLESLIYYIHCRQHGDILEKKMDTLKNIWGFSPHQHDEFKEFLGKMEENSTNYQKVVEYIDADV